MQIDLCNNYIDFMHMQSNFILRKKTRNIISIFARCYYSVVKFGLRVDLTIFRSSDSESEVRHVEKKKGNPSFITLKVKYIFGMGLSYETIRTYENPRRNILSLVALQITSCEEDVP